MLRWKKIKRDYMTNLLVLKGEMVYNRIRGWYYE
jgi:hypothetical protein